MSGADSPKPVPVHPPVSPSAKVKPAHRRRRAIVYVRQSTLQQVLNNRESTVRQYALDPRPCNWAGPPRPSTSSMRIKDSPAEPPRGRSGCLLAQPGRLEPCRHHLGSGDLASGALQQGLAPVAGLCAIFQTLLADQDGVYDPTQYNDRLLLGLKGTHERGGTAPVAQPHGTRACSQGTPGWVYNHPPIGYVKGRRGGFALDPDEQVQSVVRLIFEQFQRQGTVGGLLRYLVTHQIQVRTPHRRASRGQLQWHRPNRVTLQSMLHHPMVRGFLPLRPPRHQTAQKGRGQAAKRADLPCCRECLVLCSITGRLTSARNSSRPTGSVCNRTAPAATWGRPGKARPC